MRILLTGATGFLGLELSKRLTIQGHVIFGLVRGNTSPQKRQILKTMNVRILEIDLSDQDLIEHFLDVESIDVVIHAATNYGRNRGSLGEIFNSNLVLPLYLIKAASKRSLVFVNADSFFNKSENVYTPLIDYSLSKRALLDWLVYFSESCLVVNMRIEHMYGERDNRAKFIPYVLNNLAGTEKLALSPGNQVRDFIHKSDVAEAFTLLLSRISMIEKRGLIEYQIGTGIGTTIKELVEQMKQITGSKTQLDFGAIPYAEKEVMYSVSDNGFAREMNWAPKVRLSEGLSNLIEKEFFAKSVLS